MHLAQAPAVGASYGASPMDEPGMSYWLAKAARELREEGHRMHVHVAASASVDQSTVFRFEQQGTSRNVDKIVAAYADDLDIKPIDVWTRALQLWADAATADRSAVEEDTERRAQLSEQTAGASGQGKPGQPQKAPRQKRRP